jgi:hypothetical protein
MNDIFVIRGTLTFFCNLGGEVDTIKSLGVGKNIDNKVVIWGDYIYFSLKNIIPLTLIFFFIYLLKKKKKLCKNASLPSPL